MTHRKLFLWLFTGSLVLLLATWGSSLSRQQGFTVHWPGGRFDISLTRGSLRTEVMTESKVITHRYFFDFWSRQRTWEVAGSFDNWEWRQFRGIHNIYPPGSGGFRKGRPTGPPLATSISTTRVAAVPLLVLWLAFTTIASLVTGRMGRRAKLAEARGGQGDEVGTP